MSAVDVTDVSHRFGEVAALERVTFSVAPGDVCAVVGPTGCGKSTLLRIIAGLIAPTSGTVRIDASPTAPGRGAYLPQGDTLLPWRRALDNATLAGEVLGRDRKSLRREAHALFERFGLDGFGDAWPAQLSGGMRQRVALLRTVLCQPPVVLLDEPFAALDAITRMDLYGWFSTLIAATRPAVVLVTHDIDEALTLADDLVVLSRRPGQVIDRFAVPPPRESMQHRDGEDFAILKHRVLAALRAP